MRKTVTTEDIASHVGVTKMTVSRALHGTGAVSATTRQRILAAARELGYRPNAAARIMSRGKFGNIAVVLSAHEGRSYLPERALRGICQALSDRELQLTIAQLPDEKLTDAGFVPRLLREYCCDGMLIDYTDHIPDRMIGLIEKLRQPAIWLNRKQDHDCVYPDDYALGQQATRRLLAAGHRRIAYLDWGAGWKQLNEAHYSQRDRQAGYAEAMTAAGLTPQLIRRDDSDVVSHAGELCETVTALLAGDDRPTAFVAYAPHFARRAAAAALLRHLRVPEDLSLVAISGGGQLSLDDGRPLSTAAVPERNYGAAGVEAVLEKLEAPGVRLAPRAVGPAAFMEGQTIACPPDGNDRSVRED
ncbi:MAG: LacI family DNA-binding transcriptional regulator [Phycisphaerae bacterium]|nr:LacI family DNA-binding transcriptional regulator [Phycisphaerae bacterium]